MSDDKNRGSSDQYDHVDPPHYQQGDLQAIDVIESFGLGFHVGNVVKYCLRAGKKPDSPELRDLKKARWYLNRRIENLEKS